MADRPNRLKLISDAIVIARIHLQIFKREWGAIIFTLVFPLAMLFFASYASSRAGGLAPQLIAGTLVLSLGFSTVSDLAKTLSNERFNRQLQLIVVSPVSRASYAAGVLGLACLRGLAGATVLLVLAPLLGFDLQLSPWLIPAALLTASAMVGIALLIGTWAPTQQLGNMTAETLGILVVMVSPIYYSADRFPGWLRWLADISPYTHAAAAITGALSGSVQLAEVGILAAISAVTFSTGLRAMRWRDIQ